MSPKLNIIPDVLNMSREYHISKHSLVYALKHDIPHEIPKTSRYYICDKSDSDFDWSLSSVHLLVHIGMSLFQGFISCMNQYSVLFLIIINSWDIQPECNILLLTDCL